MRSAQCVSLLLLFSLIGLCVATYTDPESPEHYSVQFSTSAGPFTIDVTRSWAPNGADRFYALVQEKFYDDTAFFRVIPGFVVQWGINGDPYTNDVWRMRPIQDDPVVESNTRGTISFASAGPDTRTTQVFINYKDNVSLNRQGFQVFGKVTSGMVSTVDKIESKYSKQNVNQGRAMTHGNQYFEENFPDFDYIYTARVL